MMNSIYTYTAMMKINIAQTLVNLYLARTKTASVPIKLFLKSLAIVDRLENGMVIYKLWNLVNWTKV